ncbi:MAG: outer membrane beta-barrel protein [Vicingaceae bacterium]
MVARFTLTTVNSPIKLGIIILWGLFTIGQTYGQSPSDSSVKEMRTDMAILLNMNVGSVIPFPIYNIPEERQATMQPRPYFAVQFNTKIGERLIIKVSQAFSQKSVAFSASLIDQPYNGYIKQIVNGQVSEGEVTDAYFTGFSEGNFNLTYFELNSSLAYRLGKRSSLYAGLYAAYLLRSINKVRVDGTVSLGPGLPPISTRFQRSEDYSEFVKKIDPGFMIGFERKIRGHVNFNLQYTSSLSSIYKSDLEAVQFTMLNMFVSMGLTFYLNKDFY